MGLSPAPYFYMVNIKELTVSHATSTSGINRDNAVHDDVDWEVWVRAHPDAANTVWVLPHLFYDAIFGGRYDGF